MSDSEPLIVKQARRLVRNGTVGIVAASLAILPMIPLGKVVGVSPDAVMYIYFGLLGIGGVAFPWKAYQDSLLTVKEYDRSIIRAGLASTRAPEATEQDTPQRQLAERVVALADDDPHVREMVQGLLGHLEALARDAASLAEAIALDTQLAQHDDGTPGRLQQALARKEDAQRRLLDALRELHVELTLREDHDHSDTYRRVDELLATFSAEREVTATQASDSPAPKVHAAAERARQAAAEAQRER